MASPITTVQLFEKNFVFSPSEDLSTRIGAVFSEKLNTSGAAMSLLTEFGDTADNAVGYMLIETVSDWINRYTDKYTAISSTIPVASPDPEQTKRGCSGSSIADCFNGATGTLAKYWWAVHNFLQYGSNCIIAGENSTYSRTNNPLLDTGKITELDVVFALDHGATQADIVTNIVRGRNFDCFGIVGVSGTIGGGYGEFIPGVGGQTASGVSPLGASLGQYGMSVYGQKEHFGLEDEDLAVITSPLMADVAGCIMRTDRDFYPWYSPAGYVRGRILNMIRLKDQPVESSQTYFSDNKINYILTIPGQGTFLFSDKTLAESATSPYRYVNISRLMIHLIKQISPLAKRYLFEFNNDISRTSFINNVTPILEEIQSSGGILDYTVVCDESNNDAAIVAQNKFVADITIKPANAINNLVMRFTNLNA